MYVCIIKYRHGSINFIVVLLHGFQLERNDFDKIDRIGRRGNACFMQDEGIEIIDKLEKWPLYVGDMSIGSLGLH